MIKFLIGSATAVALLSTSALSQGFSNAGTDYSNATTETFTEDAMNDFLGMANSFACMIKNSRSDLPTLTNTHWEALISEVDCGLDELNSTGSNADNMSRAVFSSSRANTTSVQESSAWFASASAGLQFVTGMQFSKSPADFGPYGEWYASYILRQQDSDPASSTTNYTTANAPIMGYVDISETATGGIRIRSADRTKMGGPMNEIMRSKIEYTDSTLATATMVGRYSGTDGGGNTLDKTIAGRTNANHYFRLTIDGGVKTSACFKRGGTWKTAHNYNVFRQDTGAQVKLSGGFGFEYGATNTRGWFGQHGAWFDGGEFAFNNSTNKTAAVTDTDSETDYTLAWAPGKLYKQTLETETLPNGVYKGIAYTWTGRYEARLTINGATRTMQYHHLVADAGAGINVGDLKTNPWGTLGQAYDVGNTVDATDLAQANWNHIGWVYSPEKREMVYWDGTNKIQMTVSTEVSADPTLLAANFTALTQKGAEGFISAKFPMDLEIWVGKDGETYDHFRGTGGTARNSAYYFTGLAPTGFVGIMPRTLYIDNGAAGPDGTDKPVMFDFSINAATGRYEDFSATPYTGPVGTNAGKWMELADDWPQFNIDVTDGANNYRWELGAYPWNQSVVALKSDGSVKAMDPPLVLKYTHNQTNDMNWVTSLADEIEVKFFASANDHLPNASLCAASPLGNLQCTVKSSNFNGKKFMLEYNGNSLNGLPHQYARFSDGAEKGYGVNLINPKNATVVVGSDGISYVLKAKEIGESFVPTTTAVYNPAVPVYYDAGNPSTADCDDLSFDELNDLGVTGAGNGWQATDADLIPAHTPAGLASFPQSSKLWADMPGKNALACTVTRGVPVGCGSE